MHVHNSLEYAYERMECVRDHLMMLNISSTALFPVRSIWAAQQPAFYLQSFHFYFLIAFYCLFSPRFSCRFIQTTFFVCVVPQELFRDRMKNVSLEKKNLTEKALIKNCSWLFFCVHYFSENWKNSDDKRTLGMHISRIVLLIPMKLWTSFKWLLFKRNSFKNHEHEWHAIFLSRMQCFGTSQKLDLIHDQNPISGQIYFQPTELLGNCCYRTINSLFQYIGWVGPDRAKYPLQFKYTLIWIVFTKKNHPIWLKRIHFTAYECNMLCVP